MLWLSCLCAVITVIFLSENTTATSVSFSDCDTHYITDDEKCYMRWNGEAINYACTVKFRASGRSTDNIKICVKATTWNINDDDTSLKYYTSSFDIWYSQKKEFKRNSFSSPTDEWCADNGDYLGIQLDTNTVYNYQGEIALVVYTEDISGIVGAIVGGVIGGVVLISIIVTIIVVIACRRRRGNAGTVLTYSTSGGTVLVSQTAQNTQGQWNTGYSAPQSYAGQPYSSPQGQWNTGYSTPQNYGNGMNQPSNVGTTGGEVFNPPPYSSITDNQQKQ